MVYACAGLDHCLCAYYMCSVLTCLMMMKSDSAYKQDKLWLMSTALSDLLADYSTTHSVLLCNKAGIFNDWRGEEFPTEYA